MTRTALLVSELGVGMGHAMRLLAVGTALKQAGMVPIAAMRELWVCADRFRDAGIPVVQAPAHRGEWPAGHVAIRSYADMTAACGFHSVDALWPLVLGWNSLFDLVDPSVIVADYSPLATVAAFHRCPVVAVGDGFVLPPPHLPSMPVLRSSGTQMAGEDTQISNAAAVLQRLGRPAPESLPSLIGGTRHVVSTYPELDIYDALRQAPAQGSLLPGERSLPPPDRPMIFIYLSAQSPMTINVVKSISETRLPVEAYVRDAKPDQIKQLQALNVVLHEHPPPLSAVLRRCSLVVHHGGIGTIEACLAAGRAQLLVPSQFEQTLNTRNAVARGLAVSIEKTDTIGSLAEKARSLALADNGLPYLGKLAASIASRDHLSALNKVVEACTSV